MMKRLKKRILKIKKSIRAFTLPELLVTVALVTFIAAAGFFYLYNFKQVNALDQAAQGTVAALRYAQSQAISGDQAQKWGVAVIRTGNDTDYFEIYSGPTYASGSIVTKSLLPLGVLFNTSEEVNFSQLSGTIPLKKTVVLQLASNPSINRVITINDIGAVSIQANISELITVKSATLPTSRIYLSCAPDANTGKIYCFGGYNASLGFLNQINEYDPSTDTMIVKIATLPSARNSSSCALNTATNKIYCFGGSTASGYLNQIIEYTPATDSVIVKTATFPTGIAGLSCANNSFNSKMYCFGGTITGPTHTNKIFEYDFITDTLVAKVATLPSAMAGTSCAPGQNSTGKIYCFGGLLNSGFETNQIIEYDPATDMRSIKTAILPSARYSVSCATNQDANKIYCLGGEQYATYFDQITEYNPLTDTSVVKTSTLPTKEAAHSCATNPKTQKIYCFGGFDAVNSVILDSIFEYITGF